MGRFGVLLSSFVLGLTYFTPALACGGHVDINVVGWGADGSALVRTQHNDEDGELHALELELVGGSAPQTWEILTEADEQNRAVRGARWKKAEAELVALGVTVDPKIEPLDDAGTPKDGLLLPNGVRVQLIDYGEEEGSIRVGWAKVSTAARTVMVGPLYRHSHHMYVESVWLNPNNRNLLLIVAPGRPTFEHLTAAQIDKAFATPRTECEGDRKIKLVGWGANGEPVLRREELGHLMAGSALCSLELEQITPTGRISFPIVGPGDVDPQAARKQRWSQVESALKAAGIVLDLDMKPRIKGTGQCLSLTDVVVPGRPYTVDVYEDESPAKQGILAALKLGGKRVTQPVVVGSEMLCVTAVYLSPGKETLVVAGIDRAEPMIIPVDKLDAAWKAKK